MRPAWRALGVGVGLILACRLFVLGQKGAYGPVPSRSGDQMDYTYVRWDYSGTMCRADGVCLEDPALATPRTRHSTTSAATYRRWWELHNHLRVLVNTSPTPRLVLLGDSITETFLGTTLNQECERCAGAPEVFDELVHQRYGGALPLGISGDQTQHLLWRLQHGELPRRLRGPATAFSVLIGTNNLGAGHLPVPTARGVMAVVDWLLANTSGPIVVNAVLPRGDAHRLEKLCPPRCDSRGNAFASFMPAVDKVNAQVEAYVHQLHHTGRVSFVNCGPLLTKPGGGMDVELLPDKLHPTAEGHRRMITDCLAPHWTQAVDLASKALNSH